MVETREGRWGEVAEGEEMLDVARIEDAKVRILLNLEEDLEESFLG